MVLLDIGGYFAPALEYLSENYPPGIRGVVEDTENGHRRYESLGRLPCPVISVARSPLKDPEDFLVGHSIVFSVEALLRDQGDLLQGRTACVIGYGKLGSSIAGLLHARRVRVVVWDISATKRIRALSHGFCVAKGLGEALKGAGLVFCAAGQRELKREALPLLQAGAYVASVTSSDDSMELDDIHVDYPEVKHVDEAITRYRSDTGHYFYLLNRGQAVNFLHGEAVGPFIYLVQGEILASISRLLREPLSPRLQENDENFRSSIAEAWLRCFSDSFGA